MDRLKFGRLYKIIFNNKYVANFLDAIPGLNEILMLGRIHDLEKKQVGSLRREAKYDMIIVDAPATGHGLSALEVPNVLMKAVKVGPLAKYAKDILELLKNEEHTAFSLVTLAEEMPVQESYEYVQKLLKHSSIAIGPILINAVMPEIEKNKIEKSKDQDLQEIVDYYQLSLSRRKLHEHYIADIKQRFVGFHTVELPYLFHELHKKRDYSPLVKVMKESLQ